MARRMTAKQRKYFGKRKSTRRATSRRSSRRSVSSSPRRRRSGGSRSLTSGWLPLSTSEIMTDFAVGAASPIATSYVRPYTDRFIAPIAGNYTNEVTLFGIGAVAYKFGSGMIKTGAKEAARYAVLMAGSKTGGQVLNGTLLASNSSQQSATTYI